MKKLAVAPLVGVWIEITICAPATTAPLTSLPSWECGLKFLSLEERDKKLLVAPLVGVWIEILASLEERDKKPCRSPRGSVD